MDCLSAAQGDEEKASIQFAQGDGSVESRADESM